MAERIIISGDPGEVWTNNTPKVQYQFIAALVNTCGVCLQYHLKIGPFWPIPIHHGCRCIQNSIKPEQRAPYPFVDFRELLDTMPPDEQAAPIGASNYKLLKAGVVKWEDIVTRSRVRDLREVVAIKKLDVKQMVKAGVGRYWAERAHASVHTPEHELVEQKRRELLQKLTGAGLSQEKIVSELAGRLAARVTIAPRPNGPNGEVPAWSGGPIPGTGGSSAAELAAYLATRRPARKTSNKPPVAPTAGQTSRAQATATAVEAPPHEQVIEAAERVPADKLYGADKAWIHHVYEEYEADPANPRITLEQFKAMLVTNEVRGKVTLGRADLIQAMDPATVLASDTHYYIGNVKAATFNFVRVKPKKKTNE